MASHLCCCPCLPVPCASRSPYQHHLQMAADACAACACGANGLHRPQGAGALVRLSRPLMGPVRLTVARSWVHHVQLMPAGHYLAARCSATRLPCLSGCVTVCCSASQTPIWRELVNGLRLLAMPWSICSVITGVEPAGCICTCTCCACPCTFEGCVSVSKVAGP